MKVSSLFFISSLVIGTTIPVSQQVQTKFRSVESGVVIPEQVNKPLLLNMHSITESAMNYDKLGSKHDLVVDHVRPKTLNTLKDEHMQISNDLNPLEGTDSGSVVDTTESEVVPMNFQLISAHLFLERFLDFRSKQIQAMEVQDPNPSLTTSIKNYKDSLVQPDDLSGFVYKVVQENKEDKDFDDYDFKKYGSKLPARVIRLNSKFSTGDLINYLVDHEGFKRESLTFLNDGLDYGFDEIDEELNKIKDRQREEEKIINIGGEISQALNCKNNYYFAIGVIIVYIFGI